MRGPELLRVEHVSNGRLRDASVSVHRGEIVGVAGLLGAGTHGTGSRDRGRRHASTRADISRRSPHYTGSPRAAIRAGIGLVPEDRQRHGLVPTQSVAANLVLPQLSRLCRAGVIDRRRERDVSSRWIGDLRIKTPGSDVQVFTLSGGNQQKVVLGKWLAAGADVLIVDEPTRGIDVGAKMEIYQLLDRLAARGRAILMISSDLPEILGMSDRIVVMHQGRVQAVLDRAEATQARVLHAALGLAS